MLDKKFTGLRGFTRGFTLIETIAALVVMAITIPPIVMVITRAAHDRVTPVMFSRARWLAVEKLEDVIADRHSTSRGYGYLVSGNYPAENPVSSDPGFSRTVAFNETGPDLQSVGTGYMTVTVTVSWTDPDNNARSLDISTVVTDYSLE